MLTNKSQLILRADFATRRRRYLLSSSQFLSASAAASTSAAAISLGTAFSTTAGTPISAPFSVAFSASFLLFAVRCLFCAGCPHALLKVARLLLSHENSTFRRYCTEAAGELLI